MLSLELARTIHEDRQRWIDDRARTCALLEIVSQRAVARARSAVPSVGGPHRRGLSSSDGRP